MRKIRVKNNDWYKSWFGSKYYRILYRHRDFDEAKRFLDRMVTFLNLKKNARILDLGCGTGRHSIYLLQKGYDIRGVDLSEKNISEAKKSAIKCRPECSNVNDRFFIHDMRKKIQSEKFDIVLNLFTSFGYFEKKEDDIKVLNSIFAELKNNGLLIIDYLNVHKVIANLKTWETLNIDGFDFIISRLQAKGFIVKKINVEGKEFEERVRVIDLEGFKKYFSGCGFEIRDVFGNYDLDKFSKSHSDRLIIVAAKKPQKY